MPASTFRLPACFGNTEPGEWLSAPEVLAYLGGRGIQISAEHLDRLLADARRLGVIDAERRLRYESDRQTWTPYRVYRLTRTGRVLLRFGRPAGRAFLNFAAPTRPPVPA